MGPLAQKLPETAPPQAESGGMEEEDTYTDEYGQSPSPYSGPSIPPRACGGLEGAAPLLSHCVDYLLHNVVFAKPSTSWSYSHDGDEHNHFHADATVYDVRKHWANTRRHRPSDGGVGGGGDAQPQPIHITLIVRKAERTDSRPVTRVMTNQQEVISALQKGLTTITAPPTGEWQ